MKVKKRLSSPMISLEDDDRMSETMDCRELVTGEEYRTAECLPRLWHERGYEKIPDRNRYREKIKMPDGRILAASNSWRTRFVVEDS